MKILPSPLLKYKIYRKKLFTAFLAVLLVSGLAFCIVSAFLLNLWLGEQRRNAADHFADIEARIGSVAEEADKYVQSMYTRNTLMQDLSSLFLATTERDYLELRRSYSLSSYNKISYFPGDLKQLFINPRIRISGVTMNSGTGLKSIWLDIPSGDMKVSFGNSERTGGVVGLCLRSITVRNPDSIGRQLGELQFWADKREIFMNTGEYTGGWAAMQDDHVLFAEYDNMQEREWMLMGEKMSESQGSFRIKGWSRVNYIRFPSSWYEYQFVAVVDDLTLLKRNQRTLWLLLAAFALADAAIMSLLIANIRSDAGFMDYILGTLAAVEKGDFRKAQTLELPGRVYENEYTIIAEAMKNMSRTLEGYIQTEYLLKLKQQETDMRALNHQINPHFLYNTLETIRSRALVRGDSETADSIALLGSLFRARVHNADTINLREEFYLLKMYLQIMELRFAGQFVYEIEVEPEIDDMPTVNFWMQPLAENFFTHGFDRDSEYNLIIVTGHRENDGIHIEIVDNGTGIAQERIEEVRRVMYEGSDEPDADIGLRNVYMRLKFFYGEDFRMEIGNNPESGVGISVFIPV